MALKWAGRSHDPQGVSGTSQGELMVECPACPHPGRNLPNGWERAGPLLWVSSFVLILSSRGSSQSRFLYALFIAVDGNFQLKGKEQCLQDVELMPGWGAYVLETEYQNHIANYIDKVEVSSYLNIWDSTDLWQINTCESQHDALIRASTESTAGYAVSGGVLAICSRHCLIRQNRAGHLKKGEK